MKYFNLIRKKIIETAIGNLPETVFLPLTEGQLLFMEAHPQASYWEVWNEQINEIPQPTADEHRAGRLAQLSAESLRAMEAVVPDYQLKNAIAGVYDDEKSLQVMALYRNAGEAFRNEYYRVSALINAAQTIEEIDGAYNNKNFTYNVLPA